VALSAFDVLILGALVIDRSHSERCQLVKELGFRGDAWCTTASFTGATVEAPPALGLELEGVMRVHPCPRPG
jgi:hypothetical protein